jgi:hypothetical protein
MKKENEEVFDLLKSTVESNKAVKTVVYLVSAAAVPYMAGIILSMLAGSIRGFNDFRSAINGK